jgi:hypothetical protein
MGRLRRPPRRRIDEAVGHLISGVVESQAETMRR